MDSGNSSRIVLGIVITCGAFILGACGAGLVRYLHKPDRLSHA